MHPLEQSVPFLKLPDNAALADSRYKILDLFQKALQCLKGQVSGQSLSKAQSLAQDLGITSGQLDRKLRHCSDIRAHVLRLLQVLVANAWEMHHNDLETLLDTTLSSLVTLLSTMNDPTPSDDIEKLSQAVREDAFNQLDITRVQDKFPKCDSKLHKRICALNRLRRLRFQDAQRAFRIRVSIAKRETEAQEALDGASGSSQQPLQLDDSQRPLSNLLNKIEQPGSGKEASSIASGLDTSGSESWAFDNDCAGNAANMEPRLVAANDQPLSIPKIPSDIKASSGHDSNCPFCTMTLNKGMSQRDWEEHVLEDVEPYMCTFGGCSQSYRTYSSRKDWQQHENLVHRVSALWICHGCDETLSSAESFKDHLRSGHQGMFEEQYLDTITKMCKTIRPNNGPRPYCVLCGELMVTKSEEFGHLASHLLDLALYVFPRVEHDEDDHRPTIEHGDSHSEVFEDPPSVEGLEWFKYFGKDDAIPFQLLKRLGLGRRSMVDARECTIGPSAGTIYACKTYRLPRYSQRRKEAMKLHVRAEANTLRRLRHVHIISIMGAYTEKNAIVLVLFPVFDTDLDSFLSLARDGEETVQKKWFGCLASGLVYLHERRIRHRDLKPRNIGIKDGTVILSGFAISTDFADESCFDSDGPPGAMTRRYASPELLQYEARNSSSDVFSLGCIFFELLVTFSMNKSVLDDMMESRLYGQDPEKFQSFIAQLKGLPADVQPVSQICTLMISRKKDARPSARQVLTSLIEECLRLNTLHVAGSSLVGKCVLASMKDNVDISDVASVRALTLQ